MLFPSCILTELFTEQPLFTLSQMLDYRTNSYDPMIVVNRIADEDIRVRIERIAWRIFFVDMNRPW